MKQLIQMIASKTRIATVGFSIQLTVNGVELLRYRRDGHIFDHAPWAHHGLVA